MPKRISKPGKITKISQDRPKDFNELAHDLVRRSTQEREPTVSRNEILRVMREMGRQGGLKGGAKRREWSPERRSDAALKAARARWAKEKRKKED